MQYEIAKAHTAEQTHQAAANLADTALSIEHAAAHLSVTSQQLAHVTDNISPKKVAADINAAFTKSAADAAKVFNAHVADTLLRYEKSRRGIYLSGFVFSIIIITIIFLIVFVVIIVDWNMELFHNERISGLIFYSLLCYIAVIVIAIVLYDRFKWN